MLTAICATLAANPAPAQEGGAAADGAANRDVEPFTPQRSGLQRRANLKALIAIARSNAAGFPRANVRIVPSPVRPGMEATPQRNAIGVAMPGAPGGGAAGIMAPAGNKPAGIGTPGAGVPLIHQTPAPAIPALSHPLRGAAINGTMMGRAASGSGSVGGPAKDHSGINGTMMLPKR
jgi:hypothetical protein